MNALTSKIEEISLDAKHAEQIKVMFEVGFAVGIAFYQATKLSPNDAAYETMKNTYVDMIPDEISKVFDEIMKSYEKHRPH